MNTVKTGMLLAGLMALFGVVGYFLGGGTGMMIALGLGLATNVFAYWNSDRLALALELLADPVFDTLITGTSRFRELPDVLARLASGSLPALCHLITYDGD